MLGIRTSGERFFTTFQILGGQRIRGNIGPLNDSGDVSSFSTPRRTLRVKPSSPVKAGQLIQAKTGEVWAVAEFGTGFFSEAKFKLFKLYQMLNEGSWTRSTTEKNEITGLAGEKSTTDMGKVYYTLEPVGVEDDKTNISAQEFDLITVADLKIDDRVDGYRVLRTVEQTGVTVARVVKQ